MLKIGTRAPPFILSANDIVLTTANHHGKKMVLLFFPWPDSSGCINEAMAFSSSSDGFIAANCLVIGISEDTTAQQAKFRTKYGLTCLLRTDFVRGLCEKFRVLVEKSIHNRNYIGIHRSSFVIDEKGLITTIWPKLKKPRH